MLSNKLSMWPQIWPMLDAVCSSLAVVVRCSLLSSGFFVCVCMLRVCIAAARSLIISHFCFVHSLRARLGNASSSSSGPSLGVYLIPRRSLLWPVHYHVYSDCLSFYRWLGKWREIERRLQQQRHHHHHNTNNNANDRPNELTIKPNCFPRHVICRLVWSCVNFFCLSCSFHSIAELLAVAVVVVVVGSLSRFAFDFAFSGRSSPLNTFPSACTHTHTHIRRISRSALSE